MPHFAVAFLTLLVLMPAGAYAQAGVSYQVPADNPYAGQAGAAPEVYALGLRNPFRFSFDRQTGDVLIGDVGGDLREEIDWVTAGAARGANFGWACREGTQPGPRAEDCPVPGAVEPLYEYPTTDAGPDAVTGGFVVRDPALTGLVGRYLFADFFEGAIRSLALDRSTPDPQSTGLTVSTLASFGEDASGRLYAASLGGNQVVRLAYGGSPGTLTAQPLSGVLSAPIALAAYPGDATRLFVGERGGTVRLVVGDVVQPTPVVDAGPVSTAGERGLQSVVAAPDYPSSGRLYVHYTDLDGDIRVDEFVRSATDPDVADPASRRNVLVIEHSSETGHNGGQLHFGADGCLWITTGDGGGQNNQHDHAQNLGTLLGKVLRINPNPPGVGVSSCPGQVAAPAQPALAADTTAPVADTTAPALSARVPGRQRVLRRRGVIAYMRCDEACNLSAGGTLLLGSRRIRLRRAALSTAANQRVRARLHLRRRGRKLLRRALANGRRPRVVVRMRARDAAGNASPLVRRPVRVRR